MVHKLNPFQFNIKLFGETKWLSLSFFLSLDVCILCLLFLADHVNICIVFLSIYHNKIFHHEEMEEMEMEMEEEEMDGGGDGRNGKWTEEELGGG